MGSEMCIRDSMCWVCVYNARTGPMTRLVTQHAAVQDQKAHTTQHTHYTHMDSSNSHIAHPHTVTQHTCHGQIGALLFVFGTNPSPEEFRHNDTCNKSFLRTHAASQREHHQHTPYAPHANMSGQLLDVLIPLSDCRQESAEKMERIMLGVSY